MMTALDPLVTLVSKSLEFVGPKLTPPTSVETEVHLAGGSYLKLPPRLPSARRLRSGTYETEVTDLLRAIVMPGMTMVDIGANIGYYTVLCSQLVAERGHVYAFEPDRIAYQYLEMNVERTGAGNVTPVQVAIADKTGSRAFASKEIERGFLSFTAGSQPNSTVSTVALDDYFADQGWPAVHVIKLDVEGAERSVLAGMGRLSNRNSNLRLVMEFNLDAMRRAAVTPEDLREALVQLGFRYAFIIDLALRPISLSRPLPQSGLIYNLLLSKQ